MPVPRDLSSSCGTCVRFVAEGEFPEKNEEVEQIVGLRIPDMCVFTMQMGNKIISFLKTE
ncbi:MAG: hypothetical protein ACLVB1_01405 [Blautia obeum]